MLVSDDRHLFVDVSRPLTAIAVKEFFRHHSKKHSTFYIIRPLSRNVQSVQKKKPVKGNSGGRMPVPTASQESSVVRQVRHLEPQFRLL